MSASLAAPLIGSEAHRFDWLRVARCPLCDSRPSRHDYLVDRSYTLDNEQIPFPLGGIAVATCYVCGLHYKTAAPAPRYLAHTGGIPACVEWRMPYDFSEEIKQIKQLIGDGRVDLLDIGSGDGALLSTWAAYSRGRRSALDTVQRAECLERIDGEFIRGRIDGDRLNWSGRPYDIVTMFDVLQYLHSPTAAFQRLRELVRNNGIVIIETGNAESDWPTRYGINHWWYARLIDHHLFWSRRSLERIAEQFGFRLLIWHEVRHKTRAKAPILTKLSAAANVGLYRAARRSYPQLATLLGERPTQPWSPLARDHFRVVLRKS
jgi:SAM-dependent methyltransferase